MISSLKAKLKPNSAIPRYSLLCRQWSAIISMSTSKNIHEKEKKLLVKSIWHSVPDWQPKLQKMQSSEKELSKALHSQVNWQIVKSETPPNPSSTLLRETQQEAVPKQAVIVKPKLYSHFLEKS